MKIKILREELHLSQNDLAKAMGVDQSTVHLWESGKSFPRLATLKKLANYFKCSIDDLVKDA